LKFQSYRFIDRISISTNSFNKDRLLKFIGRNMDGRNKITKKSTIKNSFDLRLSNFILFVKNRNKEIESEKEFKRLLIIGRS